jgi:predicted DNA-binding mobile mystery protein A
MKRKGLSKNRSLLDAKLAPFISLRDDVIPQSGWLKAVRSTLGLSIMQLAKRLKCRDTGVLRLEQREQAGTASLATLDRAAKAMNCRLVWAIVPEQGNSSLSDIVEKRARMLATQMVHRVDQNMKLESQGIHEDVVRKQIDDLTNELIRNGDARIWDHIEGEQA